MRGFVFELARSGGMAEGWYEGLDLDVDGGVPMGISSADAIRLSLAPTGF